ncbi:MAG: type II toxin-antitoxin system RelB/DinJ family antitoxin [Bifidobacteriaceae bacterium]|jgi:DNA-damage-inducible protein J|nr:type II toxin-antitoxin system RelB/DinJ family antitoxin [Bifidobacteriaceae bacterium]
MTTATATVTVRLDPDVKAKAERLFSRLGMSLAGAVNVFFRQAIREQALPFRPAADPFWSEANQAHLRETARKLEAGQGVVTKSLDELEAMARG